MPAKNPPPPAPEPTFETALERLERIADEMEAERLPLEVLLERYNEGTELLKVCQQKLDAAEKKIEIITKNAAGKPQLAPLDAAPAPVPPPAKRAVESAPSEVSLF